MLRLFMIMPVLAIGLAMPVAAQQTSDQDARQAGESVVEAHNKATQARDPAEVAALFTEDAILLTPDGPLFGRAAIEKFFAEGFKVFTSRIPSLAG
jgi:ketosteroid isomerase-like protein